MQMGSPGGEGGLYLGWGRVRPRLALVDCLCWARKDMAGPEGPSRSLLTCWCSARPCRNQTEPTDGKHRRQHWFFRAWTPGETTGCCWAGASYLSWRFLYSNCHFSAFMASAECLESSSWTWERDRESSWVRAALALLSSSSSSQESTSASRRPTRSDEWLGEGGGGQRFCASSAREVSSSFRNCSCSTSRCKRSARTRMSSRLFSSLRRGGETQRRRKRRRTWVFILFNTGYIKQPAVNNGAVVGNMEGPRRYDQNIGTPAITNKKLLLLQSQMEQLQEENYRLENSRDDMRVRADLLQREVLQLQFRNEELTSLAEEAQNLKDEMDILR
ncbi:hypothetical protein CRUP_011654 [Coryphaenoides rupestris]|nr:hypothetical protein CRUP_011654 [Coryphaenoides rupestris]